MRRPRSEPLRFAFITDPGLVNSNYRAYAPMHQLGLRGHQVQHNRADEPLFNMASLLQCDAVLIHRYCDANVGHAVRQLHAAGVGVVWDNDDDVTAVPRSNPNYATMGGLNSRRIAARVEAIVRRVDVVTTPSRVLAAQFRDAGAVDVRVHENFLPPEFPQGRVNSGRDGVTLVWVGGLEHQLDYEQLQLRATFERLLDAHPELRIKTIGVGLGLSSDRYERDREIPWLQLVETTSSADFGIAPLADVPWNRARSNVKLKEYGAAGLPWLASPVGSYVGMGEREGGRLVPDHAWHEAIDELIRQPRLRRKLAKRAAKWAREQTIDRHVDLWESALRDAAQRARSRSAA